MLDFPFSFFCNFLHSFDSLNNIIKHLWLPAGNRGHGGSYKCHTSLGQEEVRGVIYMALVLMNVFISYQENTMRFIWSTDFTLLHKSSCSFKTKLLRSQSQTRLNTAHTHTHTHCDGWASLGAQWKRICLQLRRRGFYPWVGKNP